MKQIKFLLSLAVALMIAMPIIAQEEEAPAAEETAAVEETSAVTFSGDLDFKVGFTNQKGATPEKTFGLATDGGMDLTASIATGNLTGAVGVEVNAAGVATDDAWMAYDFGMVTMKYNAMEGDKLWCGDVTYADNNPGTSSLQFKLDLGASVTFFGTGYQDTETYKMPVTQVAYEFAQDGNPLTATAGVVFDANSDSRTAPLDKAGFAGFGTVGYDFGQGSVTANVVVGQNAFMMESAAYGAEDEMLMGGFLAVSFNATDVITVGADAGYSMLSEQETNTMKFGADATYKVDDNFSWKVDFNYSLVKDGEAAIDANLYGKYAF